MMPEWICVGEAYIDMYVCIYNPKKRNAWGLWSQILVSILTQPFIICVIMWKSLKPFEP